MKEKNMRKEEKGVTLIALTITLIVMAILAGVTLHRFENGRQIVEDTKTVTSSYEDKINSSTDRLEAMTEYLDKDNSGKTNYNAESKITSIIGSKKIITIDGNKIKVTEKGKINEAIVDKNATSSKFDANTKKTLSKVYGTAVKYNSDNANNSEIDKKVWRIFYIDFANKYGDGEGTIYLKADWTANDIKFTSTIQTYAPKDTLKLQSMNYKWWKIRGANQGLWNANERETAWLCDTTQWTNYKNNKSIYAIGSPSIEMYCDSYNSINHPASKDFKENYILSAECSSVNAHGYIIKMNDKMPNEINASGSANGWWTSKNSIDYVNNNSIYCGGNGTKGEESTKNSFYWYIASPSSYSLDDVIHIDSFNAAIDTANDDYTAYGVCPVVAIKEGSELEIN